RRRSVEDRGRGRGDAALGHTDQEHVPHGHARYGVHGTVDDGRPEMHAVVRVGQSRRDKVRGAVPVRRRAAAQRASRVRIRCPLLPRTGTGPARAEGDVRATPAANARPGTCGRTGGVAAPARELHQRPRIDARTVQPESAPAQELGVNNREIVEKLWADLYRRDFDAVGAAFADDGEYTDVPTPVDDVARGPAQI